MKVVGIAALLIGEGQTESIRLIDCSGSSTDQLSIALTVKAMPFGPICRPANARSLLGFVELRE
jgi:hypothetical protein